MRLVGLALHEPVPDDETRRVSSIWLFREQLVRTGAIERLFAGFDTLLREQGYLAMGGQIVDATVVQARVARLAAAEEATIRGGATPEAWTRTRKAQTDHDARWTPKRGRKRPPAENGQAKRQAVAIAVPVFGDKSRLGIDRRHGLIRAWTVTHAAAHDGGRLGPILDPDGTARGVGADTACRSVKNRARLARRGHVGHLQRRKPRGRPMPRHVARGNATRGRVRAVVEPVFAAQKRRLGLLVRTVGIAGPRPRPGPPTWPAT